MGILRTRSIKFTENSSVDENPTDRIGKMNNANLKRKF